MRFRVIANGLYVADGSKIIEEMRQVMVMTAAERERPYSVDQVKRSQEARKLQERLGYPSTDALIRSLNQGALINTPITATDVLRAREIYGPAESAMQGANRRDKQRAMGILEYVPRPVQVEVTLLADIMQVEGDS